MDELITTGRAAHILGVSPQTIARWEAAGMLSSVPIAGVGRDGSVKAWRLSEVEALAASRKQIGR